MTVVAISKTPTVRLTSPGLCSSCVPKLEYLIWDVHMVVGVEAVRASGRTRLSALAKLLSGPRDVLGNAASAPSVI